MNPVVTAQMALLAAGRPGGCTGRVVCAAGAGANCEYWCRDKGALGASDCWGRQTRLKTRYVLAAPVAGFQCIRSN